MYTRWHLLVVLAMFGVTCGQLLAEVPPLSKERLESEAALILTGTVTEAKVVQIRDRADGKEYKYELTVLVEAVKKGKAEAGATLLVRGSYIHLKPGLPGGSGHRSDNTGHRMNAIKPGWTLTLHLAEPKDGGHAIVYPNGFAVVSMSAQAEEAVDVPWPWIAAGAAILMVVVIAGVSLGRRLRVRAEAVKQRG